MNKPIIYTSEYLRTTPETSEVAEALSLALKNLGIEHRELKHTNDYWIRDFMPIHVFDGIYARYEYKPDYLYDKKSKRKYITKQEIACQGIDINFLSNINLIIDGGNYVRCGDKVIMTDKILMENAGFPLDYLFQHLKMTLCADVVMIPWDMRDPCGHADGIVADMGDGRLLLNNYGQHKGNKAFYKRLKKILDANFEVVELKYDCIIEPDSWCYLNYLRVPGAILLPCLSKDFCSQNDITAIETFSRLFPRSQIIPIYANPLVKQGGALHCVTWEFFKKTASISQ